MRDTCLRLSPLKLRACLPPAQPQLFSPSQPPLLSLAFSVSPSPSRLFSFASSVSPSQSPLLSLPLLSLAFSVSPSHSRLLTLAFPLSPSHSCLLSLSFSVSPSQYLLLCLAFSLSPSHSRLLTLAFSLSPSHSRLLTLAFSLSPSKSRLLSLAFSVSPSQSLLLSISFSVSTSHSRLLSLAFSVSPSQSRLLTLPFSVSPSQSRLRTLASSVSRVSPSQSRALISLTFSVSPSQLAFTLSLLRLTFSVSPSHLAFKVSPSQSPLLTLAFALLPFQFRLLSLTFSSPLLTLPFSSPLLSLSTRQSGWYAPSLTSAHKAAATPRNAHAFPPVHFNTSFLSPVSRLVLQEAIGVVRTLAHFGPRSSSNLSYWGLAGCVNYNAMSDYNLHADAIGNFSTGTILMIVTRQDSAASTPPFPAPLLPALHSRPLVERIVGHPIQSVLGLPAPKEFYGVNVFGSAASTPPFPAPLLPALHSRPLVERIIGHQIQSVLGLPAPKKDLYGVNVFGSVNPDFPIMPFTDFFPLIPPDLRDNLLRGQTVAGAPLSTGPGYVAIVFIIPIFRHPLPASASVQQIRDSISIAWAGVVHLEMRARDILHMLENGSTTYSFAMYDTTEAGVLKHIYGPEKPRLESGSAFPFVLPTPMIAPPEHVEPFPENMMGRTFEAHCGFQVPPPTWDLVYAPMLLGLLVLLVAVLLSTVIAVLAWKRRNIEADVKEIQICTAILERAERSKSEAVANVSHELRTPIIGMM
ncbi:unnamed protein product, partial [Closterium sp. Yama58-4]